MNKVIFTCGIHIKLTREVFTRYDMMIAPGYRWIKSKKKWSSVALQHDCDENYVTLTDDEVKALGA